MEDLTPESNRPHHSVSSEAEKQREGLEDPSKSLLPIALDYTKKNDWCVFPLHRSTGGRCTCGDTDCSAPGKHPWTKNGVKDASSDPDAIGRWSSKFDRGNIGIATGEASRVAVLDIDGPEGEAELAELLTRSAPLPETLTARTGRGRHVYFSSESPLACRKIAPHIDLKADGGYVVAPPSLHASGRRYEWLNADAPLAPVPEWVYGAPEVRPAIESPSLDPRLILSGVAEGARDDTLFRYACRLRGLGVDRSEATTLVLVAAANCDPPFEEAQTVRKVEQAWKHQTNEAKRLAENRVDGAFRIELLDLAKELAIARPPVDWLVPDYIPAARRVWAFGSAESGNPCGPYGWLRG